ncbi:MAG TPA: tetratricopeptide repeat protein [Allosphingosinicella sp.]|jgi:tetratricopeptide (TPR) repeat protein
MMGWIILLALALALLVALWRFARLEKGPLQFLIAALLLAMAGYAWQGNPGFAGAPRSAAETKRIPPNPFDDVRRDVFGGYDAADRWLTIAASYQRRGDTRSGAAVIRSALRAHPRSATLWTGYGNALMLHGGGAISPAADLAFRRAIVLAPKHPAPRLFYGMALLTGGRFAEAERVWRETLALAPPNAGYRAGLEQQLAAIAQARAAGQIK